MTSIKKKSFYNIIRQLVTIVVPVVIAPYTARIFLAETLGGYTYAVSIVTYFTLLAGLGLNNYGVQRVASFKEDKNSLSSFFSEMLFIRVVTTLGAAIGFSFLIFFDQNNRTFFLILTLNILNVFFDITWFFQGLEDFKTIAIRSIAIKILLCILTFAIIRKNSDIYLYALIVALTTLIPNILMWPSLRKKVSISFKHISLKKHFRFILGYFIPSVAVVIYTTLDKTMIELLTGLPAEVGYYEQAHKIMITSTGITNVLCPVFLPMMTGIKDKKTLDGVYRKTFKITYLISFILFAGMLATAGDFVTIYFGEEYVNSAPILMLFSVMPVLVGLHNLIEYQYIYPNLMVKQSTIIICIGAVFNFVLNIPMILLFKGFGAAITTVATEALLVILYFIVLKKEFTIRYYLLDSWKYFVAWIFSLSLMIVLSYFFCTLILLFLLIAVSGSVAYIVILIALREHWCHYFISRLFRRFKRDEI